MNKNDTFKAKIHFNCYNQERGFLNLGSVAIEALFHGVGDIIGAHPRKEVVLLQIWESLGAV